MARLALALIWILLCGCATMEESCREGDWFALGKYQGSSGYQPESVHRYLKSCPQFGVTPNEKALREGWAEGNEWYCRPDVIGEAAKDGEVTHFPSVCDWAREAAWPFYVSGRCSFLSEQIPQNEEALANLKQKLDEADNKDKRARIGFLLINLRGVVHSQRSEFSNLRCGR